MKLLIGIALVILFRGLVGARVAGDWAGVLTYPQQSLHIILHEVVRGRIIQSDSLFFATTDGAKDSRWMPWERFDGWPT